jgi:hypothetical protein
MSSKRSPHRNVLGNNSASPTKFCREATRSPPRERADSPASRENHEILQVLHEILWVMEFSCFLFNHLEVQILLCYCMLVSPVKK